MSRLDPYVDRLLRLGGADAHPASAIVGVRTAGGSDVAVGGWAAAASETAPAVPMRRDLLLDLASVTKVAATTVLVMRLVDDGRIALDEKAHRLLPAFTGAGKDDVTLEQLLTHTAGLQSWWPLYLETTDRDDALLRAQQLPLAAAPGTAWSYSDLGLILAGTIVERVTGLGLREAYRALVAEPLGLAGTYGPVPQDSAVTSADSDAYEYGMVATGEPYPVPFRVDGFAGWRDRPLRGEVNDGNAAHALGGVSGHAGLFSTVDDLLALGAALRDGAFVSEPVLRRFARPSPLNPGQAVGFRRSSLRSGVDTVTVLGHSGFTGTWFGFGLEADVVVAAAAMRLSGVVGPLPARGDRPRIPALVTGDAIQSVLLDAAADALAAAASPVTTNAEER
ncbi:serine hydrolase domain-containing protein [Leifsonia virtsii]|uniref:Serine hydrolase n=1 Tax=Leifsonia virtsii TaxID=3035915 RepID=A0ABT8J2A3_9MICO|nr:serine hydrolase domain-containing protein [Leifsonia virtsii]MDN4599213.1 serine hydrolase [Leifsonia virtsii]